MRSDLRTAATIATLALVAAACEIERVEIPQPPRGLALHGVLSATASTQAVLLERTRNGSVDYTGGILDPVDPIVSARGTAESGATVRIVTPAGDTLLATEDADRLGDGRGSGVYRFTLPGAALQRAAAYDLAIVTRTGETLTARTSVPGGNPAMTATQRVFDRASDTVYVQWPAVSGARAYFVRIESPYGPRTFFTESATLRLTGTLRNPDATGLPRMFLPGFLQSVTVSAVDANYYDWYRTHNNSVTGEGLINRVRGGIGVFGSVVRLTYERWDVTAPQTDPESGTFDFDGSAFDRASTPNLTLSLWVESRSARSDQPDVISGRYYKRPVLGARGCQVCGLLGTVRDGHVTLALLEDWFAHDTADVFTGEIRGDTLIGNYRFTGPARFVRRK